MLGTTPGFAASAGNIWSSELDSLVGLAEETVLTSKQSTQCLPMRSCRFMAWTGLAEFPFSPPSIHPNTDTDIGEAHRPASGRSRVGLAGEHRRSTSDAGDVSKPNTGRVKQGGLCRHVKHVALPQTWAQACEASGRRIRKAA